MTFEFLTIFHDFPGKFIFPGFSMIFHDRGNPVTGNIFIWIPQLWQVRVAQNNVLHMMLHSSCKLLVMLKFMEIEQLPENSLYQR